MDTVEKFPILRLGEAGEKETEDVVVREFSLTVVLNSHKVATLLCSPANLEYLAVGFLASAGLLKNKPEIEQVELDSSRGVVRVVADEAGEPPAGQARIMSRMKVSPGEVFALVGEFGQRSRVFRATGGVHGAALCQPEGILIFSEDISRHNAIDKVFGECILRDIPTADRMIVTGGRVSSEIVLKVARPGIPVLISRSAPTDLGVRLADELGMTLIGFVRGQRMNVYAHRWRVA